MLFRLHDARHRADQVASTQRTDHSESSRPSPSRPSDSAPGRIFAGLALPTAVAVGLLFLAIGVDVATSPNAQSVAPRQRAVVVMSLSSAQLKGTEQSDEVRYSNAVARSRNRTLIDSILSRDRAIGVARSLQRKELAARVAHSWQLPVKNPVETSGFGYRWGNLHPGEDFAVSIGTPLASMSTGTVTYAGPESGFGNLVEVRYWDGTVSYFGHMSVVSVSVGQPVKPGQIVGLSGNTGYSTGPHLHLEIHPHGGPPIDPMPWLADHHVAT